MNPQSQLQGQPVYRFRLLCLLALIVVALGSAPGTDAQRLMPPPCAFPPSSQVPLPAQVPNPLVGQSQARPILKRAVTKAQLNQALITGAYRRKSDHVAGLLAVRYDHAEVARALLQNGALASLANREGLTLGDESPRVI